MTKEIKYISKKYLSSTQLYLIKVHRFLILFNHISFIIKTLFIILENCDISLQNSSKIKIKKIKFCIS